MTPKGERRQPTQRQGFGATQANRAHLKKGRRQELFFAVGELLMARGNPWMPAGEIAESLRISGVTAREVLDCPCHLGGFDQFLIFSEGRVRLAAMPLGGQSGVQRVCRACSKSFPITYEQITWLKAHGFQLFSHCPQCRDSRRHAGDAAGQIASAAEERRKEEEGDRERLVRESGGHLVQSQFADEDAERAPDAGSCIHGLARTICRYCRR